MTDPNLQAQLTGVLGSFTTGSFVFTFVFGAVIIALYATNRLGELIVPPKGDEYDFTKMINLPTMVGRGLFRKSYLCYVLILEFIYLFLCTSRPLVAVISSNQLTGFDDHAWPLAAALLVVGVLPTVPFVAQIEASLRQFAHNLADIPEDFYNRIAALSTEELEALAGPVASYKDDVDRFWIANNYLLLLGFEAADAERIARKALAVQLFEEWTVEGREYWSPNEYQRYGDIFDLLKPRSLTLIGEYRALLKETAKSTIVKAVLDAHPTFKLKANPSGQSVLDNILADVNQILSNIGGAGSSSSGMTGADKEAFDQLKASWEKMYHEWDTHARRLAALFSIMARNDLRLLREVDRFNKTKVKGKYFKATLDDPVLLALIGLLRTDSSSTQPWYNSMIMASAGVFAGCIGGIFCVQLFLEVSGIVQPDVVQQGFERFRGVFFDSIKTSIEFTLSFLFAGLMALYIRSERIKEQSWLEYYDFNTLPMSSYIGILIISSCAAFLPSVVNYVAYYIWNHSEDFASQNPVTLLQTLLERFIFSLLWGGIATLLCILMDVVSEHRSIRRERVALFIATFVSIAAAIVLLATSFEPEKTPFWHRLSGIVIAGVIGALIFERNIRARIAPDTLPKKLKKAEVRSDSKPMLPKGDARSKAQHDAEASALKFE